MTSLAMMKNGNAQRMKTVPAAVLATLRDALSGPLYARGDDGYRPEIDGFKTVAPMAPDYVVGAATEHDIQLAVRFAAANGLKVAIQATGHGSYTPVTGGVLIRTHRLDGVAFDSEARTVTVGAGARWRAVPPPLAALFDEVLPGHMALLEEAIAPFVHAETNYHWAGDPTPKDFARLWPKETAARLVEIRREYDPAGVFGVNQ